MPGTDRNYADSAAMLPEQGTLRTGSRPYCAGTSGLNRVTLSFTLAAGLVAVSGVVLFGWYSIRVVAISVAVALLVEGLFDAVKGRSSSWSESHALLIGLLFGCTLPATVAWSVAATGAAIAVLVGQALAGGAGNYLWHPAALGRVAVQMLYADQLSVDGQPVLAPGSLLWGSLRHAEPLPELGTWANQPGSGVEAWLVTPTERLLTAGLARTGDDPVSGLVGFVRDLAPPWADTLSGVAGGAIGEASAVAALIVGALLVWRGFLRWPMVVSAIGVAALAAAILPVKTYADGLPSVACTLPGLSMWEGMPVGAAYVLYHLTAGGFLLVVLLLAPDPSSSPLTSRGHLVFGAIIGLLTMLLRISFGVPAAAYWALLAANTMVPTIDRLTRRRVFGT